MCTISFVARETGYAVSMNRDEQLSRSRGLLPEILDNAIYPREPNGGTWIAVNNSGLTLAIMNRNASGILPAKLKSRGELIPTLISADSLAEVHRRLVESDLRNTHPFLLLGFSFREREICEWRWSSRLSSSHSDWLSRHWYSSGISDSEAERVRSAVVEKAWQQTNAGSIEWLRQLHRSHEPKAGAFSICVHRNDAATVSYSEITVDHSQIEFRYVVGSPCVAGGFDRVLALPARSFLESPHA